jgi:hypothetical protein
MIHFYILARKNEVKTWSNSYTSFDDAKAAANNLNKAIWTDIVITMEVI